MLTEQNIRHLENYRQTIAREMNASLERIEEHTYERAVELIQRNTRHYARKQMSYWRRDRDIRWIEL